MGIFFFIIMILIILSIPYMIVSFISLTIFLRMKTIKNKKDGIPNNATNKRICIISFIVYIVSIFLSLFCVLICEAIKIDFDQINTKQFLLLAYTTSFILSIIFYLFIMKYIKINKYRYFIISILFRVIEFTIVLFSSIYIVIDYIKSF